MTKVFVCCPTSIPTAISINCSFRFPQVPIPEAHQPKFIIILFEENSLCRFSILEGDLTIILSIGNGFNILNFEKTQLTVKSSFKINPLSRRRVLNTGKLTI